MKRLLFASLALVSLASCQEESFVDTALTSNQAIKFAPYAGASTTRGAAVATNTDFQANSFKVSAYSGTKLYFGFSEVEHTGGVWTNLVQMYWPNSDTDLHFGAFYPADAFEGVDAPTFSYTSGANKLAFDYTVGATVADQEDLMYAITDVDFVAPTATAAGETAAASKTVGLHFKHALTQVAFTATRTADIEVTVKSVTLCNVVDKGKFSAVANTNANNSIVTDQDASAAISAGKTIWTAATAAKYVDATTPTNLANYAANMVSSAVTVNETVTPLTKGGKTDDVMMLVPQALTAWSATATNVGTECYLAVDCKIVHPGGEAPIVEGVIYVPFDTEGIVYNASTTEDCWLPGYKLTYNLKFGGGYTTPNKPDPDPDPKPGETPDPDEVVPTLRAITYTVTVDDWIPVTVTPDVTL